MPGRVLEASNRQAGAARPAARQARPARSPSDRPAGPAAGAGRGRSRPARRRPGARLSARAVRRAGSRGGGGLRRGLAGPPVGRRPCALDRAAGRSVRAGAGRAGAAARAPDRGAGRRSRPSLGARGSAAQPGPDRRAGRGRSPDPDPEPPAAARRRGQGGDRLAAAPACGVRCARRGPHGGDDPVADHAAAGRSRARRVATSVAAAALAGRAGPLPRRPHRRLGDRVARGRFP